MWFLGLCHQNPLVLERASSLHSQNLVLWLYGHFLKKMDLSPVHCEPSIEKKPNKLTLLNATPLNKKRNAIFIVSTRWVMDSVKDCVTLWMFIHFTCWPDEFILLLVSFWNVRINSRPLAAAAERHYSDVPLREPTASAQQNGEAPATSLQPLLHWG